MTALRLLLLAFVFVVWGCGKSTADLTAQLQAESASARVQAIHALQERLEDGPTVVPALVAVLQDADTYVRRDAARALGQFGASAAPTAVPPLIAALRDKEPSVRKAAAAALKKIDPAAAAQAGVP